MSSNCLSAYISYFPSLKNFYVNYKNDQKTIEEISASLQCLKEDDILNLDCIKIGDLVAAKYESDDLWYRAEVLVEEKNAFKVKFIDYGNSELLSTFKRLPDNIAQHHAMAYQCILNDIDKEDNIVTNNNEIYNLIFEFLTSVELTLTISNTDKYNIIKVEWDGMNFKTILNNIITYGITPKTYEMLKQFDQLGVKMQVNLNYVASITEFYVETEGSKEMQVKIDYELENRSIWEPMIEFKIGKMAIAKSISDSRWYRVRILEKCDEYQYVCYLIDYGIQEKCMEFYEVDDFLKSTVPLIKRCSLNLPKEMKTKDLLASISTSFVDEMLMSKDKNIIMTVIKAGEPCIVELIVDGLNVIDIIKPKSVFAFQVFHLNALTVQIDTLGRQYIIDKFKNIKTLGQVNKPIIGKMYVANRDDQWCRAVLEKQINKHLMEVVMIDMGSVKIQVNKLYVLPKFMENIKYINLHCSLELDDEYFSTKKLQQICNNGKTKFLMIILQNYTNNGPYIQLFLDGKDIKHMIKHTKQ